MPKRETRVRGEDRVRCRRWRVTAELGEIIELMYQDQTAAALADFLGTTVKTVYCYAARNKLPKKHSGKPDPIGTERLSTNSYLLRKTNDDADMNKRFAFAHVLEWQEHHRKEKPIDHVVVFIDGNKRNFRPDNLYCLPRSQLLGWMRFVSAPLEVHVDKLLRRVMALDTSEAVQKKLLNELERLLDPEQKVDLHRQRMVCETVQTVVNLLKVEVDYLRAIEGDGKIPFLETKHTAKARLKRLPVDPLLRGPSETHPWRGLGAKN